MTKKELKEEFSDYDHMDCAPPWNKGKKGLQTPWNKGLKTGPLSEIHKKTISIKLSGRSLSEINKKRIGKANAISRLGIIPWNKGKKQPETAKRMMLTHTIIHPNGNIEDIMGMKEFCKKHNLQESAMSLVAQGKRKHHKGYRIKT